MRPERSPRAACAFAMASVRAPPSCWKLATACCSCASSAWSAAAIWAPTFSTCALRVLSSPMVSARDSRRFEKPSSSFVSASTAR